MNPQGASLPSVPAAGIDHKKHFTLFIKLLSTLFCMSLYDELDIVLEVAVVVVVVDNTVAVGEDPHLHGSVGAAGEDVIGRPHLNLHDARAEVPEQRLASVLAGESVEWTLCGQTPDLQSRGEKETVKLNIEK